MLLAANQTAPDPGPAGGGPAPGGVPAFPARYRNGWYELAVEP